MTTPSRHFAIESWCDYARGLVARAEADRMRRHLDSGCRRCADSLAAVERVQVVIESDRQSPVPDAAMRSVKAISAVGAPRQAADRAPSRLRLLFDSDLAPAAAGTRADRLERRLMYASDRLSVDLRIEPGEAAGVQVSGEIVELGKGQLANLPVVLADSRRIRQLTTSDQHGGFEFRPEEAVGLRLWLVPPGEGLIEMPIPELGGSAGS